LNFKRINRVVAVAYCFVIMLKKRRRKKKMKSLKFNIFRYRFIFGQAGAIIICGLTLFVSLFFSFIFVNTSTTPVSSVQQLSNQRRTEDGYIIDSLFAEQYPEYKDDILTFSQEIFLFPGAN